MCYNTSSKCHLESTYPKFSFIQILGDVLDNDSIHLSRKAKLASSNLGKTQGYQSVLLVQLNHFSVRKVCKDCLEDKISGLQDFHHRIYVKM